MKVENLVRATKLASEIKNVSLQLEQAKLLQADKAGFIIASHSDKSGSFVDYVYENGNYADEMYRNIINNIVFEIEAHLNKLLKEVSEL